MRNYYLPIISLLTVLATFSCKKRDHVQPIDKDIDLCIHRIYYPHSVQGSGMTDVEMDTVRSLFEQNHLSLKNLQVIRISHTDDYYEVIHISMNQFANNLIVFYGDMSFHFRKINGAYTIDSLGISGHRIHIRKIDSSFRIAPSHAANILYRQMTNDLQIGSWNAHWKDSCYVVMLGISVVSGRIGQSNAKYGLVWRVTPQNGEYPVCFVDAISGKLLDYNDGIIIN